MQPVNDKLALLISLFQEEETKLKIVIDNCVKERDYLTAHHCSRAMGRLSRQLHTLHRLQNRDYDKVQSTIRHIARLQEELNARPHDQMSWSHATYIRRAQQTLDQLNEETAIWGPIEEAPVLEEVLQQLVQRTITNVQIVLDRDENLLLLLNYSNKGLRITLPGIKRHLKKSNLDNYQINRLQKEGFLPADNDNKLVLIITGNKELALYKARIALCKIVFEIFTPANFSYAGYIRFSQKNTPATGTRTE